VARRPVGSSRRQPDTSRYAGKLAERWKGTPAYHADLRADERFRFGGLDVVVATSAFGMGTDLLPPGRHTGSLWSVYFMVP